MTCEPSFFVCTARYGFGCDGVSASGGCAGTLIRFARLAAGAALSPTRLSVCTSRGGEPSLSSIGEPIAADTLESVAPSRASAATRDLTAWLFTARKSAASCLLVSSVGG